MTARCGLQQHRSRFHVPSRLHLGRGAPQQRRIRCSLAADQLVTLWMQRHFIRGIGGESFSQTDVQCERESSCPHRMCAACPARSLG
ncbi:hypothetical protein MC81_31065 (plasmid) [Achromobacter insolitus]|nr:hypothetical protein MC81_31065 [Achromobacter insolitus]